MTPMSLNFPHRRMEAWKWSDVARIVAGETNDMRPGEVTQTAALKLSLPDGITSETAIHPAGKAELAVIAAAVTKQVTRVTVPTDWSGEAMTLSPEGAGHARLALVIEAGANLTLIEHYDSDLAQFSNIDLQITLGAGASLTRVITHADNRATVRMVTAEITAAKDAVFHQYALSFGASLTRLETRLFAKGTGLSVNMGGAYLLNGKRHCDMTSHIRLADESAHIRQAVKGVATDLARGVFQGKFHVERAAQYTDAEMRHDALMLSEMSEIRAKPELEIYADDVACAHGNTIGQLDESALFYMRQRGIPRREAQALLTEAFVADVFDELKDEKLRESMLSQLRDWLRREA